MDPIRTMTVTPTPEQRREALTSHIARTGETEFAAIVRNRSGQDAGEIDFGLKHGDIIDDLCDGDKQSLVDTAYALAEACERATGKTRRRCLTTNDERAAIDLPPVPEAPPRVNRPHPFG